VVVGQGLEGLKDFFLALTAFGEKSDRTLSNGDNRRVFTMRMFRNKKRSRYKDRTVGVSSKKVS
jgi:hypothetical protein